MVEDEEDEEAVAPTTVADVGFVTVADVEEEGLLLVVVVLGGDGKTLGARAEVVLNNSSFSFLRLAAVFQLGLGLLVFFSSLRS